MFMPSLFRENLIDNFFDDFAQPLRRMTPVSEQMKTDVRETETGFELNIDLPGYKKEDVSAELKDGYMTVTASSAKENETKDQDGTWIRRERFRGTCKRSFYVGELVTEEDITARFEDGILKLFIPKKQPEPVIEEKKYIRIE